jgi:hypothetical protein
VRKAIMILLALTAIRILPRTLRREARALELIALLFTMTADAAANTSKTVNTADRTGKLETRAGNLEQGVQGLQSQQGTFGGFSGSNTSYGMGGGTQVTSDTGSGNNGGVSSQTSGQIGGAAAHYHSMTHYHVSNVDLQNIFNALQGSFSDVVARLNTMNSKLTAAGIL